MTKIDVPVGYQSAFKEILAEFERQDAKFGSQDHTAHEWKSIIDEEFGEAAVEFAGIAASIGAISRRINEQAYLPVDQMTVTNYITELLQTAACCIRAAVNANTRFLEPGSQTANQLVAGRIYAALLTNPQAGYRGATLGTVYIGKYLHTGGFAFTDERGVDILGFSSDFSEFKPIPPEEMDGMRNEYWFRGRLNDPKGKYLPRLHHGEYYVGTIDPGDVFRIPTDKVSVGYTTTFSSDMADLIIVPEPE